jgi:hypothetical protein
VSLLAKAYTGFAAADAVPGTVRRLNPSCYPETQGAFAEPLGREAAARLDLTCGLELGAQTEFSEPPVRINTDLLDARALGWSEAHTWDEFVSYYAATELRDARRKESR